MLIFEGISHQLMERLKVGLNARTGFLYSNEWPTFLIFLRIDLVGSFPPLQAYYVRTLQMNSYQTHVNQT